VIVSGIVTSRMTGPMAAGAAPEDIERLRGRTLAVDRVETMRRKQILENVFGDILPVKLGNRGSMQAIGLVTDVGYFLEKLRAELH